MQIAPALSEGSDIIFESVESLCWSTGAQKILAVKSEWPDRCCRVYILPYHCFSCSFDRFICRLSKILSIYVPILELQEQVYRDRTAGSYNSCVFMFLMCMFTEESSEHRYNLWEMASLPAVGAFGEEKLLLFARCLEDKCRSVKTDEVFSLKK